ncbi:MAG: dihydroorotate dehydrogenase-like protein [Agrobacterium albertimagni]
MIDLTTEWLGFKLCSPLIVAASPIARDVEAAAAAVAAGAGAVIMYSLFEEELAAEQLAVHRLLDAHDNHDAETTRIMPDPGGVALGIEPYLIQLRKLRERLNVPVVASLNGVTPGGWTTHARELEASGASAIELNLYDIATSPDQSGAELEARQIAVVQSVVAAVGVPVTVKISPFYTSIPAFVRKLEAAGARGVAVFNRFYQPDIDLDALDVERRLVPSTEAELPLRLHGLALLAPWSGLSLGCTGGVWTGRDAAKAILCGAHVVQLAAVLLQHGPKRLGVVLDELRQWLTESGYASSTEARGVMSASATSDPHAWERMNYVRMIGSWTSPYRWR